MKFDKSRVYTALNADELKIGSKVIVSNCISELKELVANYKDEDARELISICSESSLDGRFETKANIYHFAYLISEPEEKNWTVYLCRREGFKPYLTACRSDVWKFVKEDYGVKTKLFEGTEDESEKWYTSREHFADVIAAWEDGKIIQYNSGNGWEDCCDNRPAWDVTGVLYRIKQEGLKWTDLKLGDIIKCKTETRMVTGIDTTDEPDEDSDVCHICAGGWWSTDKELEEWEKVE